MARTETAFGTFSTELIRDEDCGCVIDCWEQPVPEFLAALTKDDTELVVEFAARIYHVPMSMYGGPDHLGWPEEHSDEREWRRVYLVDSGKRTAVSGELAQKIFDHYLDRIQDTDVEFPEDDRY